MRMLRVRKKIFRKHLTGKVKNQFIFVDADPIGQQ